jgi:hypothetical protein
MGGRRVTVELTPDGAGLVSRAGSALLAPVADKGGLTRDATLIVSHSDKEGAASNFKGGFGFTQCSPPAIRPMSRRPRVAIGDAGANTAADQIAVVEQAIAQHPTAQIEDIELLLRIDSARRQPGAAGLVPRGPDPLLRRLRAD